MRRCAELKRGIGCRLQFMAADAVKLLISPLIRVSYHYSFVYGCACLRIVTYKTLCSRCCLRFQVLMFCDRLQRGLRMFACIREVDESGYNSDHNNGEDQISLLHKDAHSLDLMENENFIDK